MLHYLLTASYLCCHDKSIPFIWEVSTKNWSYDYGSVDEDCVGQVLSNGDALLVAELDEAAPGYNVDWGITDLRVKFEVVNFSHVAEQGGHLQNEK